MRKPHMQGADAASSWLALVDSLARCMCVQFVSVRVVGNSGWLAGSSIGRPLGWLLVPPPTPPPTPPPRPLTRSIHLSSERLCRYPRPTAAAERSLALYLSNSCCCCCCCRRVVDGGPLPSAGPLTSQSCMSRARVQTHKPTTERPTARRETTRTDGLLPTPPRRAEPPPQPPVCHREQTTFRQRCPQQQQLLSLQQEDAAPRFLLFISSSSSSSLFRSPLA